LGAELRSEFTAAEQIDAGMTTAKNAIRTAMSFIFELPVARPEPDVQHGFSGRQLA
jgi:hypothetical protein